MKTYEMNNINDAIKFIREVEEQEIEKYSAKFLISVAKFLHIVGRYSMRKDQLVEKIKEEKSKRKYREDTVKKGIIVAIRLNSGKLTTAKVLDFNKNKSFFKVETPTGLTINKLSAERIEWFKYGNYFPSFIYDELKQRRREHEEAETEA